MTEKLLRSLVILLALLAGGGAGADGQPVRVGVLKFGTVNWELDVIQHHGLAARQGIDLIVIPLASKSATNVAIQGGAVDVIVSDWVWVSRQRAEGRTYTFVPYSVSVGFVAVRPDAGIRTLADLEGKRLGVAGGPVDKSWLLLRAYSRQALGADMADFAEPTFAAPPLLNELILRGELAAVLNFWHYGARLQASGMQPLIGVAELLPALGIDQSVPLLGWVFDEAWAQKHPESIDGFLRASYQAKRLLAESDAEWKRLDPLLKSPNESTSQALRDTYREGIPRRFGDAEIKAATRLFAVLAREGGTELVGNSSQLSEGTFWTFPDICEACPRTQ